MRKISFKLPILLTLLCLFSYSAAFAQKTVIAGKVIDSETGESLIGVSIQATHSDGSVKGAISDYDGNYRIDCAPGTYTVAMNYISYEKFIVENYEAVEGQVNPLDAPMVTESAVIAEVVIVATQIKNTDAALISLQKKSFSIQDGISSQQISRTGVANAADAMKQVTGAVVEGGKFIVMRGLGDRYSISQLNGITMPSTDPYRNSSSLDLIPSQMIDNIITLKTFTPDQPGNFSGGLVNIKTKDIPDKFNLYFGVSTSFNTQSTGNDQFLGHGDYSGNTDWLGLNDGTRDLPAFLTEEENLANLNLSVNQQARNPSEEFNDLRAFLNESGRALSNTFVPTAKTAPVNHGINFSIGDRLPLFGNTLGYSFGVNYSRNFIHYENASVNTYFNTNSPNLFEYQGLTENRSVDNPHLGGLFNLTYKIGNNNSVAANIIYNNDADIIARQQQGHWFGQLSNTDADYFTNSMEFIRRQYTSYQLSGRHVMPKLGDVELTWSGSTNTSIQEEPDSRFFSYSRFIDENDEFFYEINRSEIKEPFHFWRDLQDEQQEFQMDLSIPFLRRGNKGSSNQIKIGGLYSKMTRTFDEYQYLMNLRHANTPIELFFQSYNGDFDGFFDYGNFGIIDTTYRPDNGQIQRYILGYHYVNQINAKNFYDGESEIAAGYLMTVYNFTPKLKTVLGARVETTDMYVESRDTSLAPSQLDLTDLLYSANIIYALTEKSNLRLAATRTLARPNMRELAPFEQFDTKNGFFNIGNPELQRTLIDNYDLRWEVFPDYGELIAISVFYKQFTDPILRRFTPTASLPELGYVNIDKAEVYGAEIEYRKKLDFIGGPFFEKLNFGANFAVIQSNYDIPQDELNSSQNIDSTYDQTSRPFQGQAPFIANAVLSYIDPDKGWESTLSFNVSGRRLYNISLLATPDVYEEPFPLLNFNISKQFANNFQLKVSANNLLNPKNRKTMIYRGDEYDVESFTIGRTYGVSLAYFIR